MRQSLANYSSKAVNNLAKTYARRARAIAPFSKEEDVIVRRQDTVTVSVSRNLDKDARERAQKALQDTINASKSTFNDVWQSYLSLQAVVQQDGGLPIAQNIMQAVLRKCSPSLEALRTYSMQPASEDGLRHRVRHPLPYEDRLRAIIRHMRDAQQPPTIQDYNFILGQMAAVGHVTGAAAVLKEMEDVGGMQPSHSTFIYVLRTCVFLLESNQSSSARGALVQAATELANHVVKRLGEMNIEMDTRTMEFVLRIFKETGATAAFERLVRAMCAFDVTRPDRLPEEFEERLKAADSSGKPLPVPLPFTTSMFTTLITLYGRAGEVSKMVTAFEVLTNPYPLPSNLPPPNSDWWDEEEYDVANPVIQTPLQHRPEYVWEPPKSTPNAATYAAIIRYLAWAGHRTLCEHYMLLVVETDKREADSLRRDLTTIIERLQTNSAVSPESVSKSISTSSEEKEISASLGELSFLRSPQVFITPPMLYPVIGYANRYRLAEFIYWIRRRVRRLQARKEKDLLFFKEAYSLIPPAFQPSSVAVTRLSNMNIPCKC
jgi:hypothetical protein